MNIFKRIFKSQSLINVGKLMTGTLVGQLLSVLFVPILSRIYGPTLYGDLAVFTSISTLISGFLGFGLFSAIMISKTDEEAFGVYKIIIYSSIVIAFLLFIISIGLSPYVKLFKSSLNYQITCGIIFLLIILGICTNSTYAWLNRLGKYNVLLWNPIITPIVSYSISLTLGLLNFKSYGLILGSLIASIFTLIHMFRYIGKVKIKLDVLTVKKILNINRDFILYQYPAGLASILSGQLPVILLSFFFGNTIVGYFSLTQRLLAIPGTLIGTSVNRVYIKNVAAISHWSNDACTYTFKTIKKGMKLYFVPAILLITFGDILIPLFLGQNWAEASKYLRIMVLWELFATTSGCTAGFASVIGRQKYNLLASVAILLSDILLMITVALIYKNPILTISAFAFGHILIHIVFYNTLFNLDIRTKGQYKKYAFGYLFVVLLVSIIIRSVLLYFDLVKSFF